VAQVELSKLDLNLLCYVLHRHLDDLRLAGGEETPAYEATYHLYRKLSDAQREEERKAYV